MNQSAGIVNSIFFTGIIAMPRSMNAAIVMMTGRLMTRFANLRQASNLLGFGFSNCHLSMRSPSAIRTEGSSVTEVRTAIPTTIIPPIAIFWKDLNLDNHHGAEPDKDTKCRKDNGSSCSTNRRCNRLEQLALAAFLTIAADEQQCEIDTERESEHRNNIQHENG